MKIRIGTILICILLIVSSLVIVSPIKAMKVNGNTLYVGGSGSGNYTSIQDAIDDSSNGDTIFVYDDSSPYEENIVIDKSINLIGENNETTIIDARKLTHAIVVSADYVIIKNLNIQMAKEYCEYLTGIWVGYCNYCLIENNILTQNTNGIRLLRSRNNSIINNLITDNQMIGVEGDYVEDTNIEFNKFVNTEWAIHFDNCKRVNFLNNYVSKIGKVVNWRGQYFNISNNLINQRIMFYDSNFNTISNNIIHADRGIQFQATEKYNTVYGNTIYGCEYGFYFAYAIGNLIYHNNLINNNEAIHASLEGLDIWDNGYPSGGNYYTDYTGEDLYNGPNQDIPGPDGIGDTPYYIKREDTYDYYPLMEPLGDFSSPDTPVITGPKSGKIGDNITYTFTTIDEQGDDIYLWVDWGDGINTSWIGRYQSDKAVNINHTWTDRGTYIISAKAKDIYGYESNWTSFEISMPKTKIYNPMIQLLFKISDRFPLFEKILNQIL